MFQNKLINHLSKLQRKEFTRFTHFIQSPYHNKHKDVLSLVTYLGKIYPDFKEKNCHRDTIIRKAFQGRISVKQLAVIFTYTYNLLHKFYRLEAFMSNEEEQDLVLLDELKNLNNKSLFYEVLGKRINNTLGSYNNYRIEKTRESFENSLGNVTSQHQFLQKQAYLDHFFFLEKIHAFCEAVTLSRITKESYNLNNDEAFLNLIKPEAKHNEDLLIYLTTYETITDQREFNDGLTIIQSIEEKLKIVKAEEVYNLLQNYCIYRINNGDKIFLSHAFAIYKAQLNRDFLFIEDVLPDGHYKNITTTGLREKAFDWTFEFIHKYRHRLPTDIAETAYNFNLANYYLATGDAEEAMNLLRLIDSKDLRYVLATRALQIRIFYEQEEYEALSNLSSTFKKFLSRNKQLNDRRIEGFLNLLNLTLACAKYRSERDYRRKEKNIAVLEKIKLKLQESSILVNRSWVEGIINTL